MSGTAIFDLDQTLTRQATWMRFVWRFNGHRPTFWIRVPWLGVSAVAHKLGLIDRTGIKNRFMSTFARAERETIEAAGRSFAATEIRTGLRAGVHNLIEQHRAFGDRIYLATAASDFIAMPIAEGLGLDGVICTQTDWSRAGQGGVRVAGLNCYGAEKLRRVREAIDSGALAGPITVYSDDVSDLQLLLLADRGVAANPSTQLRNQARKRGLPIINLDLPDATSPANM